MEQCYSTDPSVWQATWLPSSDVPVTGDHSAHHLHAIRKAIRRVRETTIRFTLDIHGEDALGRYQLLSSRIIGVPGVIEVTEEVTCTRADFSFVRMWVRHQFNDLEAAHTTYHQVWDLVERERDLTLVGASTPLSDLDD